MMTSSFLCLLWDKLKPKNKSIILIKQITKYVSMKLARIVYVPVISPTVSERTSKFPLWEWTDQIKGKSEQNMLERKSY